MFGAVDAGTTALLHDRSVDFAPPRDALPMGRAEPATMPVPGAEAHPLGIPRGQMAKTYIVAEAEDGLVIVDQHAAHERLVLEQLRRGMPEPAVPSPCLVLPEDVEIHAHACDPHIDAAPKVTAHGGELERF